MKTQREQALKDLAETFKTQKQVDLFIAYIKAVYEEHQQTIKECFK